MQQVHSWNVPLLSLVHVSSVVDYVCIGDCTHCQCGGSYSKYTFNVYSQSLIHNSRLYVVIVSI